MATLKITRKTTRTIRKSDNRRSTKSKQRRCSGCGRYM